MAGALRSAGRIGSGLAATAHPVFNAYSILGVKIIYVVEALTILLDVARSPV